ncbi:TonB-linked outer membrane protein, SusC/RagA family [Xylanibacter ruminicola]|uniref:TonB-linked outer membrane protein, SusC/RagA family n=1 Tax=Xylanibacter ruminicola TaxID=839 RepID=A0A1H4E793_XYLRU|nr:TonB-dependent receptor [Xylanibacter ruminicola]SEA80669.1 TonB-linked outer membrane protein, SusC/RagA family [Xylanibacter ruminicola]
MEKRLITSLVGAAMLMAASPALAERNLALSVHSSTVAATQQQRTVTGTVVDAQGEPLIGVTVKEQGTQNAAVTDMDGRFKLQLSKSDAQVVFTYIGYVDVTARATDNMVVTMKEDRNELNEIVVVGYGTQKKVNLTGSVVSVNLEKEANSRPVTTVAQALQGMAAGLDILQGSGKPGAENFSVNIRGVGTMNDASPLVLVDGMEMSLSDVNPMDIESISILKDAASCAIYGNRGANGVILVTTKSGTEGKVNVTYTGRLSINKPSKLVRFMSNYADYMEMVNEASENIGTAGKYPQSVIDQWRQAEANPNGIAESGYPNYVAYPNTDWYDEIYQTKVMQEHAISLSGKDTRTRYNLGLTYLDNPGMIVRSGEQKYSINLKLISDVTNWLQLGAQVWGTHSDRDRNNVDALSSWEFLKTVPGIYPYYDGKFGGIETSVEDGAAHNPMQLLNGDGDSYYKTTHAYSTAYAQVKFLKDFTFKSTFGYDYYNARHKYTDGQNESYSFSRNEVVASPAALEALSSYMYYHHYYNWKITNTLNWAHTFAQKHDVGALVGFEEGKNSDGNTDVKKMGMIDATLTDLNTLTSEEYTRGNFTGYTYRSWFGRLNYAYDSRYLLEANFRYDGSSRFSPDNRWGFFPSASAGWRISEEAFAKNSFLSVFDNLKLRASYGKLGNSSVDNYAYQSWYETGYTTMGGKKVPRFYLKNLPNMNVTWETTKTFNVGLDFSTLGGRLSGVIDYYDKQTSGILYRPSIGLIFGDKVAPLQNLAGVSNRGLEMTFRWEDKIGDVTYGVAVNGSFNKNKVTDYKGGIIQGWGADPNNPDPNVYYSNLGEVSSGGTQRLVEGHMMNEFYVYPIYSGNGTYYDANGVVNPNGGPRDGMIRTPEDLKWVQDMIAAGYSFEPQHAVTQNAIWYGEYIYADTNGDKVYGGSHDQQFMGESNVPKFTFGMQMHAEWKGIDLSMNWGGATGFSTYWREIGQNSSNVVSGLSIPQWIADDHYFYDPNNPNDPRTNITSKNPRMSLENPSMSDALDNTFHLYSCDYLKLRNLTIGYTLPKNISRKIYAENLRVYFSGENLWTITSFPGLDPEMRSGEGYATMRQLSFGLNVTF